jgi:hypothetical protein
MGSLHHTPQTRARVIEEFRACGRVDIACERCNIDRSTHYDWLKRFPDYKEAFDAVRAETAQILEDEAWRRAVEGTEKPIYQGGRLVGTVREYSDSLMTWLLRGLNPQRYGERMEVTGNASGPAIQVIVMQAGQQIAQPAERDHLRAPKELPPGDE